MTSAKIKDAAGVILAGGRSSRFGSNKALAQCADQPMIQHAAQILAALFPETLLVTNSPDEYAFLGWPTTSDRFKGAGPVAGIHAALQTIKSSKAFICACDMPNLHSDFIKYLVAIHGKWDAVIPRHQQGIEPLHAVYSKSCLPVFEQSLQADERKLANVLEKLHVHWVEEQEIRRFSLDLSVFYNVNRPGDMQQYIAVHKVEVDG